VGAKVTLARLGEWCSEDARRDRFRRARFVFLGLGVAFFLLGFSYAGFFFTNRRVPLAECAVSARGTVFEISCPGAKLLGISADKLAQVRRGDPMIYVDGSGQGRVLVRQAAVSILLISGVLFVFYYGGQRLQRKGESLPRARDV